MKFRIFHSSIGEWFCISKCCFNYCSKVIKTQCGYFKNWLICKNFVKSAYHPQVALWKMKNSLQLRLKIISSNPFRTFSVSSLLVKTLLSRKFCQQHVRVNLAYCIILWKLRNFTATVFSQKFRKIDVLLLYFAINQFDGISLWGREFLVFPHCVFVEKWKFTFNKKLFRLIYFLVIS